MDYELHTVADDIDIDIEALLAETDKAIDTPTEITGTDVDSLRRQQKLLAVEMREQLNSGLGHEAVTTRRLIDECEMRLKAAEIKSAREGISEATARLAEIKNEIEAARKIKGERNTILNEKIKAVQEANVEVERVNFVIYSLEQEADSTRDARQSFRERLEDLLHDAELQISGRTQEEN